jgi:hypothetical protein
LDQVSKGGWVQEGFRNAEQDEVEEPLGSDAGQVLKTFFGNFKQERFMELLITLKQDRFLGFPLRHTSNYFRRNSPFQENSRFNLR